MHLRCLIIQRIGLDNNFNEFIDDGAFNINNLIKKTEDDVFALDDLVTNDKVAKKLTLFESLNNLMVKQAIIQIINIYSKTKASLKELNNASRAFADSSILILCSQGGGFFLDSVKDVFSRIDSSTISAHSWMLFVLNLRKEKPKNFVKNLHLLQKVLLDFAEEFATFHGQLL